jgi:hypothetical protein
MTKHHVISDLKWAKFVEGPPPLIAKAQASIKKLSKVQRDGLKFEDEVAMMLSNYFNENSTKHGPWIQYEDSSGVRHAQPDVLIELENYIWIIECKRTARLKAERQLRELYVPLIEHIVNKPIRLLQVCKYLKPSYCKEDRLIFNDMHDALQDGVDWEYATLYYRS